ncbi:MAG: mechanosensitive ion channel domain-containing protein [Pseudomonadota bacterium]
MENLSIDTSKILETIQTVGVDFGIKLISAIAIFVVGRIIVRIIMSAVNKLMDRVDLDETLQSFLGNILSTLLTLFVILAALGQLGVEMTSVIAVLGAAGLAVGLALQGSLANFASGVLIIFFRPYKADDFIEAGGVSGKVDAVTIFNTILNTPDNRRIVVPNANITAGSIINYSAHATRRIDLVIGVGYDDDLKKAETALREVVAAESLVLDDPAPTIAVSELGDSSVNFVVRPWVKTEDYWAVNFALTRAIKDRLDADGISIPYPQRDIHVYQQGSES